MQPDLELVPTEDLIDELFGRFDNAIISLSKSNDDVNMEMCFQYRGDPHTCVGLAQDISLRILNLLLQKQEDEKIEDDEE